MTKKGDPEMMVAQYRKKPVVIEAVQWFKNGDHPEDNLPPNDKLLDGEPYEGCVVRYYRDPYDDGQRSCQHCGRIMHDHGWIDTLEGGHVVCPGDWIITGAQGERYPCKPDIFSATYEALTETTSNRQATDPMPDLDGGLRIYLDVCFGDIQTMRGGGVLEASFNDIKVWTPHVYGLQVEYDDVRLIIPWHNVLGLEVRKNSVEVTEAFSEWKERQNSNPERVDH